MTDTTIKVGDTVRAYDIPGYAEFSGREVVVSATRPSGTYFEADFPNDNGGSYRLAFNRAELVSSHGETDEASDDDTYDVRALRSRVRELVAERDKANELLTAQTDRLREAQRRYSEDFAKCNELANEEADRQDYCSQYEDFLEKMNAHMQGGFEWTGRDVEKDISWEEEYTIRVRRYATVTVRRNGDESLEDLARSCNGEDDATSDQIVDAVRNGYFEANRYIGGSAEWE